MFCIKEDKYRKNFVEELTEEYAEKHKILEDKFKKINDENIEKIKRLQTSFVWLDNTDGLKNCPFCNCVISISNISETYKWTVDINNYQINGYKILCPNEACNVEVYSSHKDLLICKWNTRKTN